MIFINMQVEHDKQGHVTQLLSYGHIKSWTPA